MITKADQTASVSRNSKLGGASGRNLEQPKPNPCTEKLCSGWAIWSFHSLNYSLHISRLLPFYDPEFSATRGAWRHKVQFLMRRQHQMVAFAAPGYMIAQAPPVGGLTLSPLDRDIFVESGHSLSSGNAFYASRRVEPQRKPVNPAAGLLFRFHSFSVIGVYQWCVSGCTGHFRNRYRARNSRGSN